MKLPKVLVGLHPKLTSSSPGAFAGAAMAITVVTLLLLPARGELGLLNIGLFYLLVVVLISARWGWGPGLAGSFIANLLFNFFFVPPRHTFTVQDPHNVLALAVFLLVSSVTSALLSRARAGETAANRNVEELRILYDLSRLIIMSSSTAATLTSLCERVRAAFHVEVCAVLLPGEQGLRAPAWSGALDAVSITAYERHAAEQAITSGQTVFVGGRYGRRRPRIVGTKDRPQPSAYVPLVLGESAIGVLQLVGKVEAQVFTEDEQRLMTAFADEAALAVDRDRLLREAARAAALEEADRLKSALLAAVSHDLRTPLTAILTASSSLLQEDIEWDEATRREFLTVIEGQAQRLSRLVTNLLDLSRIEGGALRADKDWYDVRDLMERAVEAAGPALARHTVRLDLHGVAGPALLDQVQIVQVLVNLLENAAKYAPADSTVVIAAERQGEALELSVADQGPGIPLGERDRVFDKFYRLRGTAHVPGTGIGLAICKGLVEANGGTIRVEAAAGGGARFIVRLPSPAMVFPASGDAVRV